MISNKFTNVPYKVKLFSGLGIKGKYGYIKTNINMSIGTIFEVEETQYRVKRLVKIDGFAFYHLQIQKCQGSISEEDKNILYKNQTLKIIYIPLGRLKPGYDL